MPADATDDARRWALGEALLLSDELDDWAWNADRVARGVHPLPAGRRTSMRPSRT